MEQRATVSPGLPRSNPTVSYWQDPPSKLAGHRTSNSLPTSASTVIIGSGITGSSLAYRLLIEYSHSSIVLLEARTVCSGATGRNGGHTKCASYRSFLENTRLLGEKEAAKIAVYEYQCMKDVHAFARERGIQCDSWEGDTVDIIYDKGQWKLAQESVMEIQRILGTEHPAAQYRFWDAVVAEEKFLTKGAIGALTYEAGSLSGYKFVVGMLELAVSKGLNLQTETPVISLEKCGEGWTVQTTRGVISAQRVVLATNGYTAHLYPALLGTIVPLRGHVTAQRPGNKMPVGGLATTYSFIYSDGYEYMIPRPPGSTFAGDIVIGGGLTKATEAGLFEYGTADDTTTDPAIRSYLQESTEEFFGSNWGSDHPDGRIRRLWSGIMGYSPDGFPLIGLVPNENNLFIAASFQGHGMVLCFLAAKALAEIMDNGYGAKLEDWFPAAFRITEERMKNKFQGRLHTTVSMDLKMKGS